MKKLLSGALLILLVCPAFSQQYVVSKFRITFTDKNNSPWSVNQPQAFLSERALERRARYNIPVTSADLPVNPWYIDSVRNAGATILNPSRWFNSVTVFTTDSAVIAKIRSFSFVSDVDSLAETTMKKGDKLKKRRDSMDGGNSWKGASANMYSSYTLQDFRITGTNTPDYGTAYTQTRQLGADYLHGQGFRGQGMVIAVLDAGFFSVNTNPMFDSLWQKNRILGSRDFVQPGGDVFARSTHGMAVLSTMGGNIPGKLVGTAPAASYWLLRSEDADSEYPIEEDNWVSAAEFADSAGADIINSSLGYTEFYNPDWSHTYKDMDGKTCRSTRGAAMAAARGILVVNSAGNSGNDAWHHIGAPADADSIITVGAVNSKGIISGFSSRGPSYDGRVKPTVVAMGEGTYVCTSTGSAMPGNGTSFSAPVLTGSVACLWQANRDKSNMEVMDAVKASASRYFSPDSDYGYGIPNFAAANMILKGISIANFDQTKIMEVMPNPFYSRLQLVFYSNDTSSVDVRIFDMAGQMVFNRSGIRRNPGCNFIEISGLDELTNGVYILKAYSGPLNFSTKIMRNH